MRNPLKSEGAPCSAAEAVCEQSITCVKIIVAYLEVVGFYNWRMGNATDCSWLPACDQLYTCRSAQCDRLCICRPA